MLTHTHTHFHSPSNTSLNRHILSLGTPFGLCTGQAAILCQEMHTKQLRHTLSHDKLHSTLQAAGLHHWCNLIGSNSLRPHIICQKSPDPNLPPCCCDSHWDYTPLWCVHATRETTGITEAHADADMMHLESSSHNARTLSICNPSLPFGHHHSLSISR